MKLEELRNWIKEITDIDVLRIKGRKRHNIRVKVAFIYISTRMYGFTLEEIAAFLKYRDHTSIIYHRNQHESWMRSDVMYYDIHKALTKKISDSPDPNLVEVLTLINNI
jgi:hypothetical protein